MKELVKKILKGSKLGRLIYEPLRKVYRLWAVPRRRRMLKKNGPQVLKDLAVIFKKHGIPAFAAYGTMLGFVRDHGFIAHDDDIDIGVLPGEWTPQRLLRVLLDEEKGFRVLFIFKFRDKVTEFKVEYKKIPIDFFFYEQTDTECLSHLYFFVEGVKYPSPNANSMKVVHTPKFDGIEWIKVFEGEFPVLKNPERYLAALYGEGWRVPDKGWHDDKRPHIEAIDEFGYSITLDEAMACEER